MGDARSHGRQRYCTAGPVAPVPSTRSRRQTDRQMSLPSRKVHALFTTYSNSSSDKINTTKILKKINLTRTNAIRLTWNFACLRKMYRNPTKRNLTAIYDKLVKVINGSWVYPLFPNTVYNNYIFYSCAYRKFIKRWRHIHANLPVMSHSQPTAAYRTRSSAVANAPCHFNFLS